MRVILDTNVLMSGIFFSGPPAIILESWRDGKIRLILSPEILAEYERVGAELADKYPGIDPSRILELLTTRAMMCDAPSLPSRVCEDPADDKFLACDLASRCRLIVSGDKHLVNCSGYREIVVVRPRKFIDELLPQF